MHVLAEHVWEIFKQTMLLTTLQVWIDVIVDKIDKLHFLFFIEK